MTPFPSAILQILQVTTSDFLAVSQKDIYRELTAFSPDRSSRIINDTGGKEEKGRKEIVTEWDVEREGPKVVMEK